MRAGGGNGGLAIPSAGIPLQIVVRTRSLPVGAHSLILLDTTFAKIRAQCECVKSSDAPVSRTSRRTNPPFFPPPPLPSPSYRSMSLSYRCQGCAHLAPKRSECIQCLLVIPLSQKKSVLQRRGEGGGAHDSTTRYPPPVGSLRGTSSHPSPVRTQAIL